MLKFTLYARISQCAIMTTFSANGATVRLLLLLQPWATAQVRTADAHTHYFIKLTRNIRTTNINKCLSNICGYVDVVSLVIINLFKYRSRYSFVLVYRRATAPATAPPPSRVDRDRRRWLSRR